MSQRTERVQRLAREILGEEIQNLKDPRLGFATVTTVRVTPDLRQARVFVSVLGSDEEKESTMAGLRSATPVLRKELGQQARMKYAPELVFQLDTGADEAQRLQQILHRIEAEPPGTTEDDR